MDPFKLSWAQISEGNTLYDFLIDTDFKDHPYNYNRQLGFI